jgi:hypothetical protein
VEGGADFVGFFFELDGEVLVEEDGDFEDVDGIQAKSSLPLAEDFGFRGDGDRGAKFKAPGENLDEFGFGVGHLIQPVRETRSTRRARRTMKGEEREGRNKKPSLTLRVLFLRDGVGTTEGTEGGIGEMTG